MYKMNGRFRKSFHKKVYEFDAPEQPPCNIKANSVYILCNELWKNNDMDTFTKFLHTMKVVRKAIMHIGSNEPLEYDNSIINRLAVLNKEKDVLPEYLCTTQTFPTSLTLFDTNTWYYIYRAMLPTIEYIKSPESFSVLSIIYNNLLENLISKKYSKFKDEANVKFTKDLKNNHLRFNVKNEDSKELRVKSYNKSFGQYNDLKRDMLNTYYEQIVNINDLTCDNIWNLMSYYLTYEVKEDIATITNANFTVLNYREIYLYINKHVMSLIEEPTSVELLIYLSEYQKYEKKEKANFKKNLKKIGISINTFPFNKAWEAYEAYMTQKNNFDKSSIKANFEDNIINGEIDYAEFKEELRKDIMWQEWSRFQYEISVGQPFEEDCNKNNYKYFWDIEDRKDITYKSDLKNKKCIRHNYLQSPRFCSRAKIYVINFVYNFARSALYTRKYFYNYNMIFT